MSKKWYHIIGIAGITTSAIAVMLKNLGFKVTGSDEHIYSPAKDVLSENNIEYNIGYSYKNLLAGNTMPNVVVLGGSKSVKNKEVLFAKRQGIPIVSYPEIINKFVIKQAHSIVITGSYGKTSITAILVYLFNYFNIDVSYMVGGICVDLGSTVRARGQYTKYSVVEGDEYLSSKLDKRSKFFHYSPTYLVINSVEWDHTDLFKTEEDYISNFKNLVSSIPTNGIIFANHSKNIDKVLVHTKCHLIRFNLEKYKVKTNMVGRFNMENAAFTFQIFSTIVKSMSGYIGPIAIKGEEIPPKYIDEDIKIALAKFHGIKKRLEVRYNDGKTVVIDDFGSTPAKAKGSISSVIESFPDHKIIAIYEPNEGSRTQIALQMYKSTFKGLNLLILPEFRQMENRVNACELETYLTSLYKDVRIISTVNNEIIPEILKNMEGKSVVLFLGSHDFEPFIVNLINKLDG